MPHSGKHTLIAAAALRAIRPLIRLLIISGISFKDFSELLRVTFLEEAHRQLTTGNREVNASVLSLMSGIHRKDVALFLKHRQQVAKTPAGTTAPSAVFSIFSEWISTPDTPPTLTYVKSKGAELSFTSLCEKITSDIRPRAILDELLRLKLVSYDQDQVTLCKDAFIPEDDFEYKLRFFSQNISAHLASVSSNILNTGPQEFERLASHNNLTQDNITTLRANIDHAGMQILKNIYHQAEQMSALNNSADTSPRYRLSLGIFTNQTAEDTND